MVVVSVVYCLVENSVIGHLSRRVLLSAVSKAGYEAPLHTTCQRINCPCLLLVALQRLGSQLLVL
jgi:hypothetical protein